VLPVGANTDTTHTFVRMAVYATGATTVPLYPLLALTFPAPGAGTNGVALGTAYSVTLSYDETESTTGVVFINGYLSASGYSFSSPDHFDVNDIVPCQVPLLDEIADILGNDVAFYNIDASLPQQFWSLSYDAFTSLDPPAVTEAPTPITLTPFSITAGGLPAAVDVFNFPGNLKDVVLGVIGRLYTYDPTHAVVTIAAGTTSTAAPVQTGIAFVSNTFYGYVNGFINTGNGTGAYTVNGAPMFPYAASTNGAPASYPIMTAPEMFTLGGNFYLS
jgi:hypothetical protein